MIFFYPYLLYKGQNYHISGPEMSEILGMTVFVYFFLAYSLKHARDLVRAITKKMKNQPPPPASQLPFGRSQPALPAIGAGHVPLMLPPIRKGATH